MNEQLDALSSRSRLQDTRGVSVSFELPQRLLTSPSVSPWPAPVGAATRTLTVGLAGARRAEQGDVARGGAAVAGQERQRGEVADLAGVEVGLEREVELVESLVVREPGEL